MVMNNIRGMCCRKYFEISEAVRGFSLCGDPAMLPRSDQSER
jgi:hypothetical protein